MHTRPLRPPRRRRQLADALLHEGSQPRVQSMILSRTSSSSSSASSASSNNSPTPCRPAARNPSFLIDVSRMRSALATPSRSASSASSSSSDDDDGEEGAPAVGGCAESSRASPSSCPPLGRVPSRATTVRPEDLAAPAEAVSFRSECGRREERLQREQQRRRAARGTRAGTGTETRPRRVGEWVLDEALGAGFQGRTYRGAHAATRQRVVVKALRMRQLSLPHVEHVRAAFGALRALEHPNVLPLEDVVLAGARLYTVAPDVHGIALGSLLRQRGCLAEPLVAACCVQVLDALRYLHARDIVHGAVHPNNVIVDVAGVCRLADLDLKTFAERQGGARTRASICGRPCYTAPEVARLDVPHPGPAADVWALGCTAAALLEGAPPFSGVHPVTVLHNLVTGAAMPPLADPALSDACRAFLAACFTAPHTRRPTALALRRQPFLAEFAGLAPARLRARTRDLAVAHTRHGTPLPPDTRTGAGAAARPGLTLDVGAAGPEDEDDAFDTAAHSLDALREFVKVASDTASTAATAAAENEDGSGSSSSSSGVRQQCEELVPTLNECVGTQEYLLNFFAKLQDERDTLRAERRRAEEQALRAQRTLADLQKDKGALSTALERLRANAQHVERAFRAQHDGVAQLAAMLYGRLAGGVLTGTCSTLLDQSSAVFTPAERKWRPTWVVLRDNFLFFFKKGAVGGPTEIVLFDPAKDVQAAPAVVTGGREHCFVVGEQLFAAPNAATAATWLSALQHAAPWYESATPFAAVPPPAAPPQSSSSSRSMRRRTTIFVGRILGRAPPPSPPPSPPPVVAPAAATPPAARRVFGVPVAHAAAVDPSPNDPYLPAAVDVLVGDIIARGLDEEGILRVSGDYELMQRLQARLDAGPAAADVSLAQYDVMSVAGVLKAWLRSVPAPFIPDAGQQQRLLDWVGAHPLEAWSAPVAREFDALLSQALPPSSRAVLARLSELVACIVDHSDKNMMDLNNVMICLSPSLKIDPRIFARMVEDLRSRNPSDTTTTTTTTACP